MEEAEWLTCRDLERMIQLVGGGVSQRTLRLFALGCYGRILREGEKQRAASLIDVVERLVDCRADAGEWSEAKRSLRKTWPETAVRWHSLAKGAAMLLTTSSFGVNHAVGVCRMSREIIGAQAGNARSRQVRDPDFISASAVAQAGEQAAQRDILRCCVGPVLFRSVILNPGWLVSSVRTLAPSIYQERTYGHMPILADALQDAGCDNADILDHCRKPGEHVRGCWVLDLLLNKT